MLLAAIFVAACSSDIQEKPKTESAFKPLPEDLAATDTMDDVDFSKFNHDGRHGSVPCLMCHVRDEGQTRPKFSSHATCTGCHTKQFEDDTHPICSTCHTGPQTAELKTFPQMTSFRANFNHTAHFKEGSCSTCHSQSGSRMTVPHGANAHSTCFQCHTEDKIVGERNIGSCATCHEAGPANRITVPVSDAHVSFSHTKHTALNCTNCHSPVGGGNKMSVITVAMHSKVANSCSTCHNDKRAFGANDFSDCRKCHTEVQAIRSFGVRFSHDQHKKQNCATCHKAGQGINFTVPNGEAAHNTCFQCHSPMKGGGSFTSGRCFTCHQPGGTNNIQPAARFIAGNFRHEKHGFLDCDSCHTQTNGKMNLPAVAMHKAAKSGTSCASCHNNEMAFGEDFANCKRCHTGGDFKFRK